MRILDARKDPGVVRDLAVRRWETNRPVEERAAQILDRVAKEGDAALLDFTRQYDCPAIDRIGLRVSDRELEAARKGVAGKFLKALREARKNILRFHKKQLPKSWAVGKNGLRLQQRFLPLDRVGIYVPGGKAAYPSTVLMNALPAKIAGVRQIVMVTPCNTDGIIRPEVLAAALESGVTEVYRVGGAQAIAALAFGTETIAPVDKITGPGNAYVAAAKKLVFGRVGIDMIAGPTEVVIVADATANPAFIAADLIAQAEHDEAATPILITYAPALVREVELQISRQLEEAPRRDIARKALEGQGVTVLVPGEKEAIDAVNAIAPEHLEVMLRNPGRFAKKISKAGSIFIGEWSTEALGDYIAGPNHTLPTLGTARFSSPLGVQDFVRFTNIIEVSRAMHATLGPYAEVLAEAEGLHGHAASLRIRRGKT
jgi:histidinol dehydrogenase